MCGWTAIGIRREDTTSGMQATGPGHPMRVLVGWDLATMDSSSMRATGMGITAGWTMITTGTGAMIGIVIGTATMTETETETTVTKDAGPPACPFVYGIALAVQLRDGVRCRNGCG